ncbi:M1 family metallopeptidase [Salegentibacter sp. HM20]
MNKFLTFLCLFLLKFTLTAQVVDSLKQTHLVDFFKAEASVNISPEAKIVSGEIVYDFHILSETDSIYLDAREMEFPEVILNSEAADFRNDGRRIWIKNKFTPSENNRLILQFSARPKEAMYFINWDHPDAEPKQVWTQGQGKYTSHWLPTSDDMNQKSIFKLKIDFKSNFEVAANGKLAKEEQLNDSIKRWNFEMQEPMSSYLLAVAAGDYKIQKLRSASGIPIYNYFIPQDSLKVEATYRHSQQIFDFLEKEIGFAYPWQVYRQIPVQDFLYAGMENTATTIYSRALMTDEIGFKDRNYVNVEAHELAHQWFGNLITQTESKHHWLHEGFATYYALLAEREIFGTDYYYWKLYETAEQLKELSDRGKGQPLLATSASSLTYYQKGAWALHILNEKIGRDAFRAAVKNFLLKYSFSNVTTKDFIAEAEAASGEDLSEFREDWLEQTAFQATEALNSLKKSEFITSYLELAAMRETALSLKSDYLGQKLSFPVNDYKGQEVVFQLAGESGYEAIELYKQAFETNNIFVRQAIASSMDEIPQELKTSYETLLGDESWLTREAALLNLWLQFPGDRAKYLQETRGLSGFYNKNIEMLWLTLNLVTPEFEPENKQEVYNRLSGYTAAHWPFEIRENAFGYLYQINSFTSNNLKDLLQGATHHNYRFRDFCRKLLDTLLKEEEYRQRFFQLEEEVSGKQKEILDKKLGE